jgi:hypothetical protein
MSEHQSTSGLILQGLGVLATFAAVLAALFGTRWFRPQLRAKIDLPRGKLLPGGQLSFCIRVINDRRWRRATEVRVNFLKVEHFDDEKAEPVPIWVGILPLQRSLPTVHTKPPTIGPDALFDLFELVRNHDLWVFPEITPIDFQATWPANAHLRFTCQVHSEEADSEKFTVRIDWDGDWGTTDDEWDKHLKVKLSSAASE